MKEIFEKIIRDSMESIVEGAMNELDSKKKKDKNNEGKKEEILYDDDKDEYCNGTAYIKSEEKLDKKCPLKENVKFPKDYQQVESDNFEHRSLNEIGVINAYSRNRRLNIMVACAAAGLVLCMLILTSYRGNLPGEVVGIISTVSGIFGACLKDAYSFEFGSSRGSKDKDDKISATILERLKK